LAQCLYLAGFIAFISIQIPKLIPGQQN
jgi:hypothetical protein